MSSENIGAGQSALPADHDVSDVDLNHQGTSGWEVADSVASGVESVARGIGWFFLKLYGLAWIAAGIFVLIVAPHWFALLLIAYGTYILFGGTWIYL